VDDAEFQTWRSAFQQELQRLGWTDGRHVRLEIRTGGGDPDRIRRYAEDLVALGPDVILVSGAAGVAPVLKATRSVPVVFTTVVDPVGAGFVDSLARPGGNATGFVFFEYSLGAKWLELLKEIAPRVTRVAVIRDPEISAGIGQFGAIQAAAPSIGLELIAVSPREAVELERAIAAFTRTPNGGLIATASALTVIHRDLIVGLAAKHKLPAVYHRRLFAAAGGLISYGPDTVEPFRRAAGYVDRILKGEKPADLPVQAPTKYELAINLKTAKALGLTVPSPLLARADELIE
jgi:putative ABC transport system substrate-binding protein